MPIDGFVATMAKNAFRTEVPMSEETIERWVKATRTGVRYNVSGRAGLNPSIAPQVRRTATTIPAFVAGCLRARA